MWYGLGSVSEASRYARVALPIPLGRAFTYRVPLETNLLPGARVLVELGRRKLLGIVLDLQDEPPAELSLEKLKPIVSVVDPEQALTTELLGFLRELARYYVAPIGEVVRLALPALERATARELEGSAGRKLKAAGRIVQMARAVAPEARPPGQAPRGKAVELLQRLEASGPLAVSRLSDEWSTARSIVKSLALLGWVEVTSVEQESDPFLAQKVERDIPPQLNADQAQAVKELCASLDGNGAPRQFLLDGVTASGKTEVYLHAAAHAADLGKGVILLVPEIALTPQLVGRFVARLGNTVAVLHSGLSEKNRLWTWRKLRAGELRVVVGARSALFAPVQDLGLICVDEEHDSSYKQEEGVRYNARDMALLRAHRAGAVCVLGSATPSLASEASVRSGKLKRLILRSRAHRTSRMPEVETIDLTRFGAGPSGDPLLSLPLHRALEENVKRGDQAILFLNRRGFAPSLICADCGEIVSCPHCSVALTVHRAKGARLECHYCDYQRALPDQCPACQGCRFVDEGSGTERIQSLLEQCFPQARVARMDRDVASGLKSEAVVEKMRQREVDILVGTQMVTKGHDLPGVTLVGVLNADAALSLPDFRAAERTFHQLVQVAGRAGRAEKPGRVLIQTRSPAHPAILSALRHDVRSFVEHELAVREEVGYPPFAHVALVRFDGVVEGEVAQEARRLAALIEKEATLSDVELLGPAPAPLARLRNRFRYRFMLRCARRRPLQSALLLIARAPPNRRVRMGIDVDPQSML